MLHWAKHKHQCFILSRNNKGIYINLKGVFTVVLLASINRSWKPVTQINPQCNKDLHNLMDFLPALKQNVTGVAILQICSIISPAERFVMLTQSVHPHTCFYAYECIRLCCRVIRLCKLRKRGSAAATVRALDLLCMYKQVNLFVAVVFCKC